MCERRVHGRPGRARLEPDALDLLIIATYAPEYVSPPTSAVVQGRLGAWRAGTFDVHSGCAGYVAAHDVAAKYLASDARYQRILVVGAYAMTKFLDPDDKETVTICADGAGARVVERADARGVLASELHADGRLSGGMGVFAAGTAEPITGAVLREGTRNRLRFVQKYAASVGDEGRPRIVRSVLGRVGASVADVDPWLWTQVNLSTIETVTRGLDVPMARAHAVMHKWGYTGAGCLPMALDDARHAGVDAERAVHQVHGGDHREGARAGHAGRDLAQRVGIQFPVGDQREGDPAVRHPGRQRLAPAAHARGRAAEPRREQPARVQRARREVPRRGRRGARELGERERGSREQPPVAANGFECWKWFDPAHQGRDAGEPALLAALVEQVARARGVDVRRVHVAGLCAGGVMALTLGAAYPEGFASVTVASALPLAVVTSPAQAWEVMRSGATAPSPEAVRAVMGARARVLPLLVLHGSADATVVPSNGRRLAEQWAGAIVPAGGAATVRRAEETTAPRAAARGTTLDRRRLADGRTLAEHVAIDGLEHAWSGGSAAGTYTHERRPSATAVVAAWIAPHALPPSDRPAR